MGVDNLSEAMMVPKSKPIMGVARVSWVSLICALEMEKQVERIDRIAIMKDILIFFVILSVVEFVVYSHGFEYFGQ